MGWGTGTGGLSGGGEDKREDKAETAKIMDHLRG